MGMLFPCHQVLWKHNLDALVFGVRSHFTDKALPLAWQIELRHWEEFPHVKVFTHWKSCYEEGVEKRQCPSLNIF